MKRKSAKDCRPAQRRAASRESAKVCGPAKAAWCAVLAMNPRPAAGRISGTRNPAAKLADADVARLRRLYAAARELGCSHGQAALGLAACFRIHERTVGKIVWRERRA